MSVIKRYYYDDEVADLVEADDEVLEGVENYEDGYDERTGEFYWTELSYYTIPAKTNHFDFYADVEEEEDF